MEERQKTVVWLSKHLSCSRANVYKIFEKYSVDTEMLARISAILNFDFFSLFGRYKEKKQSRIISANSSRSKILAHHVSDWFTCQPIGGMIFNI